MTERRFRFRTRWGIALRYSGLSPAARAVAHGLATFMKHDGSRCGPGLDRITQATGYSRATVCRALAELQGQGWIHRGPAGGRGSPTVYTPTLPQGAEERVEQVLGKGRTHETLSGHKGSHPRDERVAPMRPTPISLEEPERDGGAVADPEWVRQLLAEARRRLTRGESLDGLGGPAPPATAEEA